MSWFLKTDHDNFTVNLILSFLLAIIIKLVLLTIKILPKFC